MRTGDLIHKEYEEKVRDIKYKFCHYKQFDYNLLRYIWDLKTAGNGERTSYNDVIIMADTETSKKKPDTIEIIRKKGKARKQWKTGENHVVCWTISIRAYHHNIVTLYGRKPSKLIETLLRIHMHMNGLKTVVYFHNFAYDHTFLRKFAYKQYGLPKYQLNVKSQYPIYIEYDNGLVFKDSLILAQRKLEKWADDLNVEHKKATGKWDYDLIRDQDTPLSDDEKEYIEHDTLAGVECIDATLQALQKDIRSVPLTATGIPREQTRKRGKRKAHEFFQKIALTLMQYKKFTCMFHGGYTHGNRHYVDTVISKVSGFELVKAFDFCSSYPYALLGFKYPMEKFTAMDNCDRQFILDNMEDYAFAFKLIAVNIHLKTDMEPMPALQFSKCVKTINAICDNGRILAANYVEIYLTEYDLAVIDQQYEMKNHICVEVESAYKDYLPRWFTDYIFEAFKNKCFLKHGDAVLYSIAKALVNSLYGMTVQKAIKEDIIEDYISGEFKIKHLDSLDEENKKYEDYLNKLTTIFPYQWGVWCTAIAFYNVHRLARCCRLPLYMDTDSCYGIDWDMDLLNAYNQECKDRLTANGYGSVTADGKEYWLGVAEHEGDKDTYTEFRYEGAKRYCGRKVSDGQLHSTVAGVPKSGAICLDDNIENFHAGFVFDGTKTGKKTHVYFNVDSIYIDDHGNETGDSISLIPCDYELDSVNVYNWEELFDEEVSIQIYDEY